MTTFRQTALVALALGLAAHSLALAEEEKVLNLYIWPGYIADATLERFTAETGIKVISDFYDSNEALLAKLQAGATGYDVVVPSDYIIPTMIEGGLLAPLNSLQLANGGNIAEAFRDPAFDPGRVYTAPYMWGTTGIAYDSTATGGPLPDSWSVFFEPGALAGRVAALDDEVEMFSAAAYYLGFDRCTENPAEAQQILDLLLAQKPQLMLYSSSGTVERLVAGEVAMHQMWNGAAHVAKTTNAGIAYIYPKEGLSQWLDNLAVPVGAAHPENAQVFINWLLDPKNAAEVSNATGYMNGLTGSEPFLDPALASNPAVNMPAEFVDRLRPNRECPLAARELRTKVWTKLKQ